MSAAEWPSKQFENLMKTELMERFKVDGVQTDFLNADKYGPPKFVFFAVTLPKHLFFPPIHIYPRLSFCFTGFTSHIPKATVQRRLKNSNRNSTTCSNFLRLNSV